MSEAKKVYNIGVIGLGEGRSVLSAIIGSKRWNLSNICDLNENLCKQRVHEFGLKSYTTAYSELLNDEEIDVIAIYTPDQLHGKHIIQALKAGKHVICTKPLLNSLDEADEILKAQHDSGKQVFVGQSSRFFEPFIQQRIDYEKGKHGQLLSIETQYITDGRWFLEKEWSKKPGFSWMYGFMIHAVDMVRWYIPDIAEIFGYSVISENTISAGLQTPDTLTFIAKDTIGRTAVIRGSYASPVLNYDAEPAISCLLRGSKGISRAEYPRLRYYSNFQNQEAIQTFDELHDYYFRFEKETHHAGEYQNYIEHFANHLDNGTIAKPDAAEAIITLELMAAMEKTLKTGMPVKLI